MPDDLPLGVKVFGLCLLMRLMINQPVIIQYQVAINAVIEKYNISFRSDWNQPIFTTECKRLGYPGDQTIKEPNPWEVGRAPRHISRELDNLAGNSITNYIKVLMVQSRQIIKEFVMADNLPLGVM